MRISGFSVRFMAAGAGAVAAMVANACDTGTAALKGMLDAEYAFAQQARTSVRAAFLEYLAEESLVLQATPVSGRAFYADAKDHPGSLEWYPAVADIADSDDLGFTAGPWTNSAAGTQIHGHFLTIWKRDAACRWRVVFDGGVSHAAMMNAEPKLVPNEVSHANRSAPPPQFIVTEAVSRAMNDFQEASRQDGLSAALRTYALTADFRLYADNEAPMGVAAANRYLTGRVARGTWQDDVRGRSADSTLAYSVGVLNDARRRSGHASYVQIWQYDPRIANWGLRVLLISPLMTK